MNYELDDNRERLDLEAVWNYLSSDAYWHRWRRREDVEYQFRGAWRVIGAYIEGSDELIGFARGVSDGVSDAYLADVYVAPFHRGQGVGGRLVESMVEQGLGARFRWFLSTGDAHALYARYGFRAPDERVMERPGRFERIADGSER
jgi:GNAT superfamily N-acetyltransferase